jgi:hypothetical protein
MSMMTQRVRDFIYYPYTVWSNFFHPTINFGCNVSDVETEHAVLNEVGSYGKQLNKVLDAMVVLIKIDSGEPLTDDDIRMLYVLKQLHLDASDASKRAEHQS